MAAAWVLLISSAGARAIAQTGEGARPGPGGTEFQFELEDGAIVSLRASDGTEYIANRGRLGDAFVRFRQGEGGWQSLATADERGTGTFELGAERTTYRALYEPREGAQAALSVETRFAFEKKAIVWTLTLRNRSGTPLEVGDLAVPLPMSRQSGRNTTILKHSFISGHGSFIFWMRSQSEGPYLALTPSGDTTLEFWERRRGSQSGGQGGGRRRGAYHVYVHSRAAGAEAKEQGCNWRQPHTSATLAPAGQAGDSRSYAFKLRWAGDYDGVRRILVEEDLIDVHVVPGMTVPSDLFAEIALCSRQEIEAVEAEFPQSTRIEPLGRKGDARLLRVHFSKLGENRLTVRWGGGRRMFLEFFSTEPLETLIKKRAAFIARSQHRDPAKWYDGLITDWNMESRVLLGPDNYDRIRGFRIYAVTCDDPGLAKPAFLAAKNAEHPVQKEVEALDYYIRHFVWGGLQRTTEETYPYAIYGIPDWKRNRESADGGPDGKLHVWRVYDYPHVVLMYYSLYRVAKSHPHIETALSAKDYLTRAHGTAQAMFTVPLEIRRWSAYRTGFYNELVIVDLIRELEAAGMREEADGLRGHWERKVKYFVNDTPNLFASEYAFDSTGFESTHAIARYALRHADREGEERSDIPLANARRFMERQIAANIFCRGWLEPAYYYLGSDYRGSAGDAYTLTYMSQMGGWSLLDYAFHFAADPAPYLRLGYASYLSAWALMNTGTPESNYGYWYPGKENDGGAGGGFEPAATGRTWLGQPHHRGSWYYACEIDLGYCGALRSAATVLADDPLFGRFCFGGDWRKTPEGIEVVPKDGVRRRFRAVLAGGKLELEVEVGRFAASRPIVLEEDLSGVRLMLESDNPGAHSISLHLSGLAPGEYAVSRGGTPVAGLRVVDGRRVEVEVSMEAGVRPQPLAITRRRG